MEKQKHKVLPFGLRSAHIIFAAIADALQWLIQQKDVDFIEHCLDDYIIGAAGSDECAKNLQTAERVFSNTGTTMEQAKKEGPATCIQFLEMDPIRQNGMPNTADTKLSGKKRQAKRFWIVKSCMQSSETG